MKAKQLTVEHAFYALAFALGLGLRIFNLGATPLSDHEASWALQAMDLARGGEVAVGANPIYVIFTGALFYILGESNSIARLLPALVGSSLVLVPLIFRQVFSSSYRMRIAGIILAFGLALDPGLVTVSRLAGGPMLALGFVILALGMAYRRQSIPAGIFAGLALLSGPALFMGAVGLLVTWGLIKGMVRVEGTDLQVETSQSEEITSGSSALTGPVLQFTAAVVLLGGTLFLIAPEGLSGFAATIPTFLRGWVTLSGVPALRLPVSLLVYQLLIVLFGVIAGLRGWLHLKVAGAEAALARRLSVWALTALLVAMIYPGRQVYDLIWMLVPLWGLASLELARYVPVEESRTIRLIALAQALLVFILLTLAWLNFMGFARFRTNDIYYWAVVLGALVMILIASLLVGAGWSAKAAQLGAAWGLCATLGLSLLSSTWGLSQLRQNSPEELYSLPPATGQVDLLLATIGELSHWETGFLREIDLTVVHEAPSLRWSLRDFPQANYVTGLSSSEIPSAIITPQAQESPALAQSYRGQDFTWSIYQAWEGVLPPDRIAWLAYHQAPLAQEQIILWGRTDLFPGGELEPPEDNITPPEDNIAPPEDNIVPPEDNIVPPGIDIVPPE